jgi:uncharacterized surface anchored protein
LANVVFTVKNNTTGASVDTSATDANGVTCLGGLTVGTNYTVTEKSAPTGYDVTQVAPQSITISNDALCSDTTVPDNISFTNTPLSKITVSFNSLAGPGVTSATVQCTGEANAASLPEGSPKVLNNLQPGTYTCTVVVDP